MLLVFIYVSEYGEKCISFSKRFFLRTNFCFRNKERNQLYNVFKKENLEQIHILQSKREIEQLLKKKYTRH